MTLEKSFPAMGTVHTITIFDAEGPGAASDARTYLMSLNRAWTCFHEDSLISTINRAAGSEPVSVDMDTFEVLRMSKRYSELTEGAFDVTVGPLADLWREAIREQRLPTDEGVWNALKLVGWRAERKAEGPGRPPGAPRSRRHGGHHGLPIAHRRPGPLSPRRRAHGCVDAGGPDRRDQRRL